MLSKEIFTKGMALLTEALPPKHGTADMSKNTINIIYQILSDIVDSDFEKAVLWHLRNSKYRPSPAEIREAVKTLSIPVKGGDEAWGDVIQAISSCGYYRTPEFSDPVTAKAVERMDWQSICKSSESDLPTIRAQFRNLYDNIRKNEEINMESQKIVSIANRQAEQLTADLTKALSVRNKS
jgi:hypothetical protein